MVIVSEEEGQTPLEMVHWKVFIPTANPVTGDEGEEGLVMVPLPVTSVHSPVPVTGTLPFSMAEFVQMTWSVPALAEVGDASRVIVTVSEEKQTPLVMVQAKEFAPMPSPVTDVAGDKGDTIVPDPAIKVHKPVPITGVLPFKTTESAQMV